MKSAAETSKPTGFKPSSWSEESDPDHYRILIENVPAMLWLGDTSGACVFLNGAQRRFWGVDEADVAGFDWSTTIHPDDLETLHEPHQRAMAGQQPFTVEARYRRADGEWRILRTDANPRFDADGTFLGMTGVNTDVTEQRAAEDELRRSSEHLQHALDAAQAVGTFFWDIANDRMHTDRNFALAHGVEPAGGNLTFGIEPYFHAIAEEDIPRAKEVMQRVLETGGDFENEYRVRLPGRPEKWLYSRGSCKVENGRTLSASGVVIDVTERKKQEHRLSLLTREMSHRIKNIFAIVRAMTTATAREEAGAREALGKLEARFAAMATAYSLVARGEDGSEGETRLMALLETLFAPYQTASSDRIVLRGEDVQLSRQTATSLALIFHELATNSAKYGALANQGSIRLEVCAEDGAVAFDWRESGGPEIGGEPRSSGFGTQLIRASVANLGGKSRSDWNRSGLHWRLEVPQDALSGA